MGGPGAWRRRHHESQTPVPQTFAHGHCAALTPKMFSQEGHLTVSKVNVVSAMDTQPRIGFDGAGGIFVRWVNL